MKAKSILRYGLFVGLVAAAAGLSFIRQTEAQQAKDDSELIDPSLAPPSKVEKEKPSSDAAAPKNNKKSPSEAADPQANSQKTSEGAGVDAELVQSSEPDSVDLDANAVKAAESDNETQVTHKVDEKSLDAIRSAVTGNATPRVAQGEAGNGLIMPHLIGPNIPNIPINLLFPQGVNQQFVAQGPAQIKEQAGSNILMRGIDRSTGKVLVFNVPVGSSVRFQNINIAVSACYRSNPDEAEESWAYVDAVDLGEPAVPQLAVLAQRNRDKIKQIQSQHRLRKGWIIASSPYVTPIDHPIYDLQLIRCEGGQVVANKDDSLPLNTPASDENATDGKSKHTSRHNKG